MAHLTPQLLHRFDRVGPRYTSYPTADRMHPGFGEGEYEAALAQLDVAPDLPLSVYAHFPHCTQICRYCACNIIGTKSAEKRADYVSLLLKEVGLVKNRLPNRRRLGQLHFGGGTPNSYSITNLASVVGSITAHFLPDPDAEIAIEIDPRYANLAQLKALRNIGFNRVSFGVQDFDELVQAAIGRYQSGAQTRLVVEGAREAGFASVNMDLVYGLPKQTRESFAETLTALLELRPDRVALFSFAFIPRLRINQRRIDPESLPPTPEKLAMLCDARDALGAAGYVAVGMDHFDLPTDQLATAREQHRLSRNFQGYTVKPREVVDDLETIGVGLTSIGDLGGALVQNVKAMDAYERAVTEGRLPVERGFARGHDDRLRRAIISSVMTDFAIPTDGLAGFQAGEVRSLLNANASVLAQLEHDGLVERDGDRLVLTDLGELFPRLVAMTFDAHFAPEHANFSRMV